MTQGLWLTMTPLLSVWLWLAVRIPDSHVAPDLAGKLVTSHVIERCSSGLNHDIKTTQRFIFVLTNYTENCIILRWSKLWSLISVNYIHAVEGITEGILIQVQIEKKGKEIKVMRGNFNKINVFYFDQLQEVVKETMLQNHRTPELNYGAP